jgi:hypothetical protein
MTPAERISTFVEMEKVRISHHARIRMFERNISTDKMLEIVAQGEIIEEYLDNEPCPAVLILGFINDTAYHVVVAFCQDNLVIVTVYLPEKDKWVDFRWRKEIH